MKLSVQPAKLSGIVDAPGSKSHTIRALAIATMASGASIIKAPLISSDTLSCLTAASALGAWVKRGDDSIWKISGTGGNLLQPAKTLDMGNSGTGTRLFTALASLARHLISFDGDESLRSRPMSPLLDSLQQLGVSTAATVGKCPVAVQGPLQGGQALVDGKSSQYLSALLLAAPLAPKDTLLLVHDLNEVPYVDITLDWLKREDISIKHDDQYMRFEIKGGQHYKPFTAMIPGDFSTACFPLVAAAVTGGKIKIRNLDFNDPQGDKKIFDYMKKMGASIDIDENIVSVRGGRLKAVELDLNATPDALPILAVAAAYAKGRSVFKNVAQARIKETDRIAVMAQELRKMNVMVEEFEDGLAVTGGNIKPCQELDSHQDHRIAMALAIAAMAMPGDSEPCAIDGAECIGVTYPGFIQDFTELGAHFYQM